MIKKVAQYNRQYNDDEVACCYLVPTGQRLDVHENSKSTQIRSALLGAKLI